MRPGYSFVSAGNELSAVLSPHTEVGFMIRKIGAMAKPNVIIAQDGDTWTLRSETSLSTNENKFKIGEEFEETTPDGRKVQVACAF